MKKTAFLLLPAAVVIATRIPIRSKYLYSWDSISFALSVDRYDLTLHQPHPPGYILYSGTLRLLHPLIQDPNLLMIWLNIAATIGGAFLLALLVRELSDRESLHVAAGAAALYITNPIVWFYGCVAEIYALEGFFVALVAYLIVASGRRSRGMLWASLAMGIAGGFRFTTEIFLIPFYLAGFRGKDRKTVLSSIAVLLVSNLLWLAPLAHHTGGIQNYVRMLQDQTSRAAEQTIMTDSQDEQDLTSRQKIPFRLLQILTIPLLFFLLLRIHRIRFRLQELLLLIVLIPPLATFLFVHFPKDGYLLFVVPILLALASVAVGRVYGSQKIITAVWILACGWNSVLFLVPEKLPPFFQETARPHLEILQTRMDRFESFFRQVSDRTGSGPRMFVMGERHYFPSWRTILYYYPEDEILLLGPKRHRAFLGTKRRYEVIRPPFPLRSDAWLIVVGKKEPHLPLQTFEVDSYSYFYSRTEMLPQKFQLYSMTFRVIRIKRE